MLDFDIVRVITDRKLDTITVIVKHTNSDLTFGITGKLSVLNQYDLATLRERLRLAIIARLRKLQDIQLDQSDNDIEEDKLSWFIGQRIHIG